MPYHATKDQQSNPSLETHAKQAQLITNSSDKLSPTQTIYQLFASHLSTGLDQGSLEEMQLLQPGLGALHLLHGRVPVLPRKQLGQGIVIAVRVLVHHCEDPAMSSLQATVMT